MVADSMDEKISFHNAFSAFSSASRGFECVSQPSNRGLATSRSVHHQKMATWLAAVSLVTLYPAANYKDQ